MSQISRYLRRYEGGYMRPGCESFHMIATDEPFPNGARWSFDGNVEKPTFDPSVRVNYNGSDADQMREHRRAPSACCHYFLRAGVLQFCGDLTHPLAGQHVPLPEIPAAYRDKDQQA